MDLRLSIIIPVYNTEQWIARCLDSCLNQDIPHEQYEIIVVNDGTPDRAMSVVNGYAAKYANIKVVEQSNAGLSAARNTGLSHASGANVWFVDSDDYIECNCLAFLLSEVENKTLDVLCFKPYLLFEDGTREIFDIPSELGNDVCCGSLFMRKVAMPPAAWCALYRRGYLLDNDLKFMPGIYHEDQEFTPRAYFLASRIAFSDRCIYYYFQRSGSIMKSSNPQKAIDLLSVADSLSRFIRLSVPADTPAYAVMLNKVSFAFAQSLANCAATDAATIRLYESKPYYPLAINDSLTTKEKMKYRLINVSVRLYLLVYKYLAL